MYPSYEAYLDATLGPEVQGYLATCALCERDFDAPTLTTLYCPDCASEPCGHCSAPLGGAHLPDCPLPELEAEYLQRTQP